MQIMNFQVHFGALIVQRVLALCDFWDLEKFALAKNRIRHVSIANVRIN